MTHRRKKRSLSTEDAELKLVMRLLKPMKDLGEYSCRYVRIRALTYLLSRANLWEEAKAAVRAHEGRPADLIETARPGRYLT